MKPRTLITTILIVRDRLRHIIRNELGVEHGGIALSQMERRERNLREGVVAVEDGSSDVIVLDGDLRVRVVNGEREVIARRG